MVTLKSFDREFFGADMMTRYGVSVDFLYKLGVPIKENAPKGKRNCEENYEIKLPLRYDTRLTEGGAWDFKIQKLIDHRSDSSRQGSLGLPYYEYPPISLTHLYLDLGSLISKVSLPDAIYNRAGIASIHYSACGCRDNERVDWTAADLMALDTFCVCLRNEIAINTCNMLGIQWKPLADMLCDSYGYSLIADIPTGSFPEKAVYTASIPDCQAVAVYCKGRLSNGNVLLYDLYDSIRVELTRLLLAACAVAASDSLQKRGLVFDLPSRILSLTDSELKEKPVIAPLYSPSYDPGYSRCRWCQWLGYSCSSIAYTIAVFMLRDLIRYIKNVYSRIFMKPVQSYASETFTDCLRAFFKTLNKLAVDLATY